MKNKLNRD